MSSPADDADLERGRALAPLVRVQGLDHLILESPDPVRLERFFLDFGLLRTERRGQTRYLRTLDCPRFTLKLVPGARGRLAAVALRVGTEQDLTTLAGLPEASPPEPTDGPGGGSQVRLSAPGGLVVHAVHGIEPVEPLPARAGAPANVTGAVHRIDATVRVPPCPSQVLRIGHAALESPRPRALVLWLMRTLGMIVSDYQVLDDPSAPPIVSFLRCDLGDTPADHHTLAVALAPHAGLAHMAFEVRDLDEVGRGAAHLRRRGHRHAWGIGRHILGSQVFDYWRSPDGLIAEHYCDGDVLAASVPTGRMAFRGSNLAQWGAPPPFDFALPPLSPASVVDAVRGLIRNDEVSIALLAKAARALST